MKALVRLFIALALSLSPLAADNPASGQDKKKVSAVSAESYQTIFLEGSDLPGWKMGRDFRSRGPDRGDKKFAELKGIHSGSVSWDLESRDTKATEKIIDIRWVFPSAEAAQAYLKASLTAMSEGFPPVKNAPRFGDESHVFGGPNPLSAALGMNSVCYFVIFRQDNVVVKLFRSEFSDKPKLAPLTMAAASQRIVDRIKKAAATP